ncbi:protein KINESIN LIGHT CHAIN-RELATED 3 [Selaginella moellendorffii]|nr:protein KINESIN LIGHT CHAIN-RELATED 3 [Selaginella moellendorffii]XP_024530808.1 protein KINESIN LIGHT CHAIN-RELATED 3 [Selaginella moellendorffii]|eukprot:XP_002970244.2 protein KINESIN LIGHT CHAIN-RELATED 3 [Selaginella moellendorffii]
MVATRLLLLARNSFAARRSLCCHRSAAFLEHEIWEICSRRSSGFPSLLPSRYFGSNAGAGSGKEVAKEEKSVIPAAGNSRASRKGEDHSKANENMEDKPKRTKKVEEPKLPASRKGDVEEVADGAKAKPKKTKVVETEAKLLAPRKDLGSNEAIEGAKPKPKRSRKVKGEEEKDSSVSGNGKEVTKAKSKGTKKVPVEEGMESELSAPGQRKTSKSRTQSAKKVEETVKAVGTVGLVAENSMELEKKVEKRPPKPGRQAAKKMELLDEAARIAGTDGLVAEDPEKSIELEMKERDPVVVVESSPQSLDVQGKRDTCGTKTPEFVENNLDSEISVPLVEESGASQQASDDAAKPETTETVKVAETDNVVVEKDSKVAEPSPDQAKTQYENVVTAEAKQDDFLEVDDELKEFLMDRKLQQEQVEEDEDDEDDHDYVWDYRDIRQLPSSVKHLEKKLKELSSTAPPDDRRIAVVKLKLGQELCSSEHLSPQRAVDLANEALKVLGVGGDGSIEQGMCLAVLGAGYRGLEQYEKSFSYLKRASTCFDEMNEKGQEVVREMQFTTNQLGLTYLSLGRIKQGVESLIEALDLQETVLPCDDPDLGSDFRKAAEHLCDVEQWEEAKKLCEKAIRIHSKIKGFDNEEVGHDRKIMARIYRGLSQHEKALEQFRIARQIFNEDEENIYWANMGIADSQMCMESYSEAIATIEGAMESIPKKPVTYRGTAYLKLAKAFYLKKDFNEGIKRLMAALEFYKANLGAGSMDETASQLHEIAALFDAMGDVKGSIRTLKIAIAAYDCVPGAEKLVMNAKMDLGSQLIRHKKPESALRYYEEAMELSRKLGLPSLNLLTLTGIAHMELSNHQAAMEVLQDAKALLESPEQMKRSDLSKKICFPKLPVYHNLVTCYQHFERYDDALDCQKLLVAELRIAGREAEEKLPDATRVLEELMERSSKLPVQAQA